MQLSRPIPYLERRKAALQIPQAVNDAAQIAGAFVAGVASLTAGAALGVLILSAAAKAAPERSYRLELTLCAPAPDLVRCDAYILDSGLTFRDCAETIRGRFLEMRGIRLSCRVEESNP